jgi:hypothetical protein
LRRSVLRRLSLEGADTDLLREMMPGLCRRCCAPRPTTSSGMSQAWAGEPGGQPARSIRGAAGSRGARSLPMG